MKKADPGRDGYAGGLSYIVSPCKYAKLGLMQDRVKKTVELYGLNVSSHCDVLSAEVLRFDFDPQCPASADRSLKGKLDVIKEYEKYGIDLTSENVAHPFVGHMEGVEASRTFCLSMTL